MGDYYKIKKILLICMIVLTILRIFKGSSVFASEAVEVTPTWNDGNYTVQADNNYLTIQQSALNIQETIIDFYYFWWNNGNDNYKSYLRRQLTDIYRAMGASINRTSPSYVTFYRVNESSYQNVTLGFAIFGPGALAAGSLVTRDATLSDGYKLIDQPFYQYSLTQYSYKEYIRINDTTITKFTSGTSYIACAEVGCYSPNWVDLFQYVGLITNTSDYNNILENIQGTQSLIYQQELTQSYYATENNEILSNTYNYLESTQHVDETSMPFQTITANDPYDFTDFLDNLEDILTNENYVSKQFTLTLPNNRSFNFSINPNMTEQLLTRIGGENVYGIITVMWYMGIYGIIIFDFKRMLNQILSGDWMNITTDSSPIDNVVSASFNATGATSTSSSHSGGDR